MGEMIKVEFTVSSKLSTGATIEMTREQYDEWCERIDDARGFELERVAEQLMETAGVDFFPHGDISNIEVEDFCEVKPKKAHAD